MTAAMQRAAVANFRCNAIAVAANAPANNVIAKVAANTPFSRRNRVSCCLRPSLGDRETSEDTLPEISLSALQGDGVNGRVDLKKLMSEAEQNILHINRGRVMALEKLQKAEHEKDLLGARIAQLKAENEARMAEVDLLRQKAKQFELSKLVSGHEERPAELMKRFNFNTKTYDPPSLWSDLLLRIDAMTLTGILQIEQAACLRKLVWARDAQTADVFSNLAEGADSELAAGLLSMTHAGRRRGLHIVHICTEMAPIAQSGSVSFYVTNLCKALQRKGHLVEVILPKYSSMDLSAIHNLQEVKTDIYINFGDKWYKNRIWTGTVYGIAVTLLESHHPGDFFTRDEFYDYNDDFERFTYFCKLSLEYLLKLGKQADILHLHNWQTAAVAPMFWEQYAHQGLQDTRLVLTCHDFKYQCLRDPDRLSIMGLNPGKLDRPDRLQDDFEPCFVNILKGGIVYSNKVTTVSPIYAADSLTEQFGYDMHVVLNNHKDKFIGIYNGLDDTLWDPASDSALPEAYSLEKMAGKSTCKRVLRQELGLPKDPDNSVPLVGCILFEHSDVNLDLIVAASKCAVGEAAQFVCAVHNSSEQGIRPIEIRIEKDLNVRLLDSSDEALLHRIVAASDILFCPDVFEPAGQSPMIAMRYGAVPVARQVRGVPGSITNVDEKQHDMVHATGFPFYDPYASGATKSLRTALQYLKRHPQQWTTLVRNGMANDLSWDRNCVESYEAAYWSLLGA